MLRREPTASLAQLALAGAAQAAFTSFGKRTATAMQYQGALLCQGKPSLLGRCQSSSSALQGCVQRACAGLTALTWSECTHRAKDRPEEQCQSRPSLPWKEIKSQSTWFATSLTLPAEGSQHQQAEIPALFSLMAASGCQSKAANSKHWLYCTSFPQKQELPEVPEAVTHKGIWAWYISNDRKVSNEAGNNEM